MPSHDRGLHALGSWLDSWRGISAVTVGMHRQGYDLQLTAYDERGWWTTFSRAFSRREPFGWHLERENAAPLSLAQRSNGQETARNAARKKSPPSAEQRVLPMQLRVGDRIVDATGGCVVDDTGLEPVTSGM
jgi:hypothetical protein